MTSYMKAGLDFASLGVIGATILAWLPYIAAALPVIYWLLRIAETDMARRIWWRFQFRYHQKQRRNRRRKRRNTWR